MDKLVGGQVFPGIAVAPIKVLHDHKFQVLQCSIEHADKEIEYTRFLDAISSSKSDLLKLQSMQVAPEDSNSNIPCVSKEILNVHIMFLDDIVFHQEVKSIIDETFSNAEKAVKKVIQNHTNMLEKSGDIHLIERVHDINEIGMRIIYNLGNFDQKFNVNIDHKCILVANNLMPTQLLHIPRENLLGIVLEEGGKTSHTAIIAKAYGIPMIIGVKSVLQEAQDGSLGILDANNNVLMCNVDEETVLQYKKLAQIDIQAKEKLVDSISSKLHASPKGTKLIFELNIDVIDELDTNVLQFADGIGLFRSEFLMEQISDYHTSEDIQFQIYKDLLLHMDKKPVTIRTFDAGGDKSPISVMQVNEENPLLGYRGIRYCLSDKRFFSSQLKALLRAAKYGNLRILIPMISSLEELLSVRELIEEAISHLRERGEEFESEIPLGIMIEVPSVLYILPEVSKYCDFFSIGTNDLLQYSMATDRDNVYVSNLYNYYQPSFLRILRDIFYQAYQLHKDITLCGEMASFEQAIPLLLGAGLRRFSVAPSQLAKTISSATSFRIDESRHLFESVLTCSTIKEVEQKVEEFHSEHNSDNR